MALVLKQLAQALVTQESPLQQKSLKGGFVVKGFFLA